VEDHNYVLHMMKRINTQHNFFMHMCNVHLKHYQAGKYGAVSFSTRKKSTVIHAYW